MFNEWGSTRWSASAATVHWRSVRLLPKGIRSSACQRPSQNDIVGTTTRWIRHRGRLRDQRDRSPDTTAEAHSGSVSSSDGPPHRLDRAAWRRCGRRRLILIPEIPTIWRSQGRDPGTRRTRRPLQHRRCAEGAVPLGGKASVVSAASAGPRAPRRRGSPVRRAGEADRQGDAPRCARHLQRGGAPTAFDRRWPRGLAARPSNCCSTASSARWWRTTRLTSCRFPR